MTDLHKAISGALFDFAGFLTTRPKSTPFGSCEDANAAVELLQEWAGTRGLQLDEADVGHWSEALAAPVAPELMVDCMPPATRRDQWLYEQGRLAERDPRSHPSIEDLCARIKAADDAAADGDYMLDSNDCISVLRGTWKAPLAMDKPAKPVVPPGYALVPVGAVRAEAGFRFDGMKQEYIPTLLVEFAPVAVGDPDGGQAKGWKDRDALLALVAAAPKPKEQT